MRISTRVGIVGGCIALSGALAAPSVASTGVGRRRAGFTLSVAIGGDGELTGPDAIAVARDGRIFVAELGGRIKVFDGVGDTTPTVFADLSTEVHSRPGHGLLGLALDPGFPAKPYVYALYSRDAKTKGGPVPGWHDTCPPARNNFGCITYGRLVRLTASGDVATGTPKVLLDDWCNQFDHAIGALRFGPDGFLYASSGDGSTHSVPGTTTDTTDYGQFGSPKNPCGDPPGGVSATLTPPTSEGGSLRAQDVRTNRDPAGLAGTIIRINPTTGAAALGNPFSSSADLNKRRVIAYGLRNPFRFTFRPGTSEIWASDPGLSTYEEINRVRNASDKFAENFGWPCYEGPSQQALWSALHMNLCESLYAAGTAVNPAFSYLDAGNVVTGDGCPETEPFGTAVTGIAFYQGASYPAPYRKALFFSDVGRTCLWAVPVNASGVPVFASRQVVPVPAPTGVTDIASGPSGDLLFVDVGTNEVLQLQYD